MMSSSPQRPPTCQPAQKAILSMQGGRGDHVTKGRPLGYKGLSHYLVQSRASFIYLLPGGTFTVGTPFLLTGREPKRAGGREGGRERDREGRMEGWRKETTNGRREGGRGCSQGVPESWMLASPGWNETPKALCPYTYEEMRCQRDSTGSCAREKPTTSHQWSCRPA